MGNLPLFKGCRFTAVTVLSPGGRGCRIWGSSYGNVSGGGAPFLNASLPWMRVVTVYEPPYARNSNVEIKGF